MENKQYNNSMVVALSVTTAAWRTEWEQLLKAVPWLMGLWLLAFVAAKFGGLISRIWK